MQALTPDEILPALADRCGARTREGGTCHNRPMLGGARCRMHGGASPQARAKAAERLAMARDLALETLIKRIDEEGDLLDPKLLLESTVRLTEKVELLEGRATDRKESRTVRDPDQIRAELESRIDELRQRRQQRETG
jgi:hypothetical protein